METLNWWEVKLPGHYWEIQSDGDARIFRLDADGDCFYIGDESAWYFNESRTNVNPKESFIKYVRIEEPEI